MTSHLSSQFGHTFFSSNPQTEIVASASYKCVGPMALSNQYDKGRNLQLMEPKRIEEEDECFYLINKHTPLTTPLQLLVLVISQGINVGNMKKQQDARIYTCNGLMMHTKKSLTRIKGLFEAKVDKICEVAGKLVCQGFMTGGDLLIKITIGSQALDELLGGGIETFCITKAFGEFRQVPMEGEVGFGNDVAPTGPGLSASTRQ